MLMSSETMIKTATILEEVTSFETEDANLDQDIPRIIAECTHYFVDQPILLSRMHWVPS